MKELLTLTIINGDTRVQEFSVDTHNDMFYYRLHEGYKPLAICKTDLLNQPQYDPKSYGGYCVINIDENENRSVAVVRASYNIVNLCIDQINQTKNTLPPTEQAIAQQCIPIYQKLNQRLARFLQA